MEAHVREKQLRLKTRLMILIMVLAGPLGIAGQLAFFVAYSLALSWADYSYVQPASSVAYVVVAILGIVMLHESVSPLRWLGIGVICLGVVVVGRTHPNTTGTP